MNEENNTICCDVPLIENTDICSSCYEHSETFSAQREEQDRIDGKATEDQMRYENNKRESDAWRRK